MPWGDAKHLVKWRESLGIGQVELAHAAGVSQQLVSFIENEERTFTDASQFKLWGAIMQLGFERVKQTVKLPGDELRQLQVRLTGAVETNGRRKNKKTVRDFCQGVCR